jgi:hypothetical protein
MSLDEQQKRRAEHVFRREQQKADAPNAAAQQAVIDRTRKLREARLAREAKSKK